MRAPHGKPRSSRIRVRPTRLGAKAIVFYVVLLTTFFAIPYSNLFFLGIAFLSVIAACNVLWAHLNLRGVTAAIADLPPHSAGCPIHAHFVVECAGAHRRFAIRGSMESGRVSGRTTAVDIAGPESTLVVELDGLPRGVYRLGSATVQSTYPYGLVHASRSAATSTELIVHPAPIALVQGHRRSRSALLAALALDHRASGDTGSAGVRDWRSGDEVRRVHWKATARRGALVVRESDDDDSGGVEIVLDRRCPAAELETALATVTTLAFAAQERKEQLTLHTQGTSATYGLGGNAMRDLWRLLATVQALPIDAAAPPLAPTTALRVPHRGAR